MKKTILVEGLKGLNIIADKICYNEIHYRGARIESLKFEDKAFKGLVFKGLKGLRFAKRNFGKAKAIYTKRYGVDLYED